MRALLNKLRDTEATPHKIQRIWDTLRWFSKRSPPPEAHEEQKGPPQTDGGTHTQRRGQPQNPTSAKDFRSISQHDKQHPFPEALLCEVRHILVGPHKDTIEPGQPFYLEAIHDLAKQMNDADQDYPLTLRGGVPLGVSC